MPGILNISFFLILFFLSFTVSAGQKQPYLFDVNLAEKPDTVSDMINDYSKPLPDLPLYDMTGIELEGPVTLSLFKETVHFLELLASTDKSDYVWPRDNTSCTAHNSFVMPQMLVQGASSECSAAYTDMENYLADLSACGNAAEPEMYVLSYPPGVVNADNTGNILDLIGVMGSTLTQFPPLYDGVLPDDFVVRLRDILRKLRYDNLIYPLNGQITAFGNALNILKSSSDCFIAEKSQKFENDLKSIIDEATVLRDHIEKLKTDGESEYEKEKLRLGAVSRERKELPYTSLTQADREFLAFWLGAVYWRLRGGGFIKLDGTQDARRFGLRYPFNVIGELSGQDDGKEAADGIYCEIFSGWGEWFDMGNTPDQEDKYYDLVAMTNRGYEQVRTAVSGTTVLNPCTIPDPPFVLEVEGLNSKNYDTTKLIAAGLTMGPCYYYSWDQLHPWVWGKDVELPYTQAIDGPTAIGELCIGGALGLGLVRVLMNGWATGEPPTCIIDCDGKECGDNNCGGICGYCDETHVCQEETGQCIVPVEEEDDDILTDDDTIESEPDEDFIPEEEVDLSDEFPDIDQDEDTISEEDDNIESDEDTVNESHGRGCGCTMII